MTITLPLQPPEEACRGVGEPRRQDSRQAGGNICHQQRHLRYLSGMTLKMDRAGRVILPKPVRDRLGLRANSDLEVEETPEGLILKPVGGRPSMVKKQGLWVHTAEIPPGYDIVQAIRDDREERIRHLSGL